MWSEGTTAGFDEVLSIESLLGFKVKPVSYMLAFVNQQ